MVAMLLWNSGEAEKGSDVERNGVNQVNHGRRDEGRP